MTTPIVTPEILVDAVGCSRARAEMLAAYVDECVQAYNITTPPRLAAFLAQVGHESGSLQYMAELWGPTVQQQRYERDLAAPWPSSKEEAKLPQFERNRLAYTLGNLRQGDGRRYRGRGPIQVTGARNYAAARDRMRNCWGITVPDFEAYPERLEEPRWAVLSAGDYWTSSGCNALADVGDFDGVSDLINRGRKTEAVGDSNGYADRLARWERAKAALATYAMPAARSTPRAPISPPLTPSSSTGNYLPAGEGSPQESPMAPFIAAALPAIVEAIPKLGRIFGSGSAVAERNIKAAELAVDVVQQATGAANAQAAVEAIQADPTKLQAASQAIEARWLEISEAGSGGIAGARQADAAMQREGDIRKSASFWMALALLPLVYMLVASLIGLLGTASWSDDVRAGLAGSLISAIVGGLVGYYYGTSTSRNRAA